ncbi:MAG TPA: AtpZ/AtpI family protein [Devosiaceae bacterium]|jgi:ATP synthase protein I|nr:AtpZ/AtpI family protein [Devosiaceae bacterium]
MANPRDTKSPEGGDGDRSATGDLAARIARAKAARPQPIAQPVDVGPGVSAANRAFRLASEFVAAIIVGAGIGYGIDALFGTRPWAMVILLLLGFAAGVVNVVRSSAELNAATAVPPDTPAAPDDDDDD